MKPGAGRDPRDVKHRFDKGRKILAEALCGEEIPDHGIFPGLGNRWADTNGEPVALLIPKNSFKRITEKIVRGIFYIAEAKFIEPPHTIDCFVFDEDGSAFCEQALERFGTVFAREPGIVVRRAVAAEDGISALLAITFWKQFKTYASVTAPANARSRLPHRPADWGSTQ
jgi:hypothetical protein